MLEQYGKLGHAFEIFVQRMPSSDCMPLHAARYW
jgi:hypothetical protein